MKRNLAMQWFQYGYSNFIAPLHLLQKRKISSVKSWRRKDSFGYYLPCKINGRGAIAFLVWFLHCQAAWNLLGQGRNDEHVHCHLKPGHKYTGTPTVHGGSYHRWSQKTKYSTVLSIFQRKRRPMVLIAWLISHDWKYYWLIYCERKILFVGWKSTTNKLSEGGKPCCSHQTSFFWSLLPREMHVVLTNMWASLYFSLLQCALGWELTLVSPICLC